MVDSTQLRVDYANMIDLRLRSILVTLDGGSTPIFNTRYEGDPKAGAVKIPVRDTEVSVGDYDPMTGATLTKASTGYLTVTDFNDVAVNELIDGFESQAVPDNIVADRLDSAGYSGGLRLDTDALTVLAAQGTTNPDATTTTHENVYSRFVAARTVLSNNKVPSQGRYAIVSPEVYGQLLLDTDNFIRYGDASQNMLQQGFAGSCAGFAVKEATDLPAGVEMIFGHADWAHRIREWVVLPHVQDLNGDSKHIGASAVQGRWIFKHKVSKAAAIYVKTISVLTVTSAAGSGAAGTTAVTVSPVLGNGHTYVYKAGAAGTVAVPAPGSNLTGWTAWNGTDVITAATGADLVVAEVVTATVEGAAAQICVQAGKATVTAHA